MTTSPDYCPGDANRKRRVTEAWVLFAVALALLLTIGLITQVLSLPLGLVVTEVFLILLPAVVYVRVLRLPVAEALRWRPVPRGMVVRGVVLGVLGWGAAIVMYLTADLAVGRVFGPDPLDEFWARALPSTVGGFGVFLLLAAALPGLCEETLFRGAIQGTFERKGAWKGILYTALLFAVYHVNPWGFLPAFGLGVLLGLITVRTNSTLPAIICHACNNATAFTVAFVNRENPEPYLLVAVLAVLFVPALAEFLYRTRDAERTASPLTTTPSIVSRRARRAALAAGAALATFVILVMIALRVLFFGVYRMTGDHLAPEVHRGDHVVVLKRRCFEVNVCAGDVVAFKRNGYTVLRKVTRVDDDVWIVEKSSEAKGSESRLPRGSIIGKMVYTFRMDGR